jgi:hypothetical protein
MRCGWRRLSPVEAAWGEHGTSLAHTQYLHIVKYSHRDSREHSYLVCRNSASRTASVHSSVRPVIRGCAPSLPRDASFLKAHAARLTPSALSILPPIQLLCLLFAAFSLLLTLHQALRIAQRSVLHTLPDGAACLLRARSEAHRFAFEMHHACHLVRGAESVGPLLLRQWMRGMLQQGQGQRTPMVLVGEEKISQ